MKYKLTPLQIRRDIAMLGLLHRCALKIAPPQLCELFPLAAPCVSTLPHTRLANHRHSCQLCDPCYGKHSCQLHRSLFGLVAVYNLLPAYCMKNDVRSLQGVLQSMVVTACSKELPTWKTLLNRSGYSILLKLVLSDFFT